MTPDAADGLGRWRGTRPSRSRSSRARAITAKWLRGSVLTALLMVAAGALGYLIWLVAIRSQLDVEFVPFFVGDYEKPEVPPLPWVDVDRKAFEDAQLFNWKPLDGSLTTEVSRDILKRLQQKKATDAVVVYLSTHALIDSSGAVQIVLYDSDPYAPKTLLPFKDVVAALKACPAENKLLVLDGMSASSVPMDLAGTSDGVADLVGEELTRDDDSDKNVNRDLQVLLPCQPGESALWSEPLGQSVFGHFFQRAFSDLEADTDHDHELSVTELKTYLTENVDRWARQHRGVRQRPLLLGKGPPFLLASVDPRKARPPRKDSTSKKDDDESKSADKEKASAKEKADDASKEGDKAKKADEKPGKESNKKESDKDAAVPVESARAVYPQWLTDYWGLRNDGKRMVIFRLPPACFGSWKRAC